MDDILSREVIITIHCANYNSSEIKSTAEEREVMRWYRLSTPRIIDALGRERAGGDIVYTA